MQVSPTHVRARRTIGRAASDGQEARRLTRGSRGARTVRRLVSLIQPAPSQAMATMKRAACGAPPVGALGVHRPGFATINSGCSRRGRSLPLGIRRGPDRPVGYARRRAAALVAVDLATVAESAAVAAAARRAAGRRGQGVQVSLAAPHISHGILSGRMGYWVAWDTVARDTRRTG